MRSKWKDERPLYCRNPLQSPSERLDYSTEADASDKRDLAWHSFTGFIRWRLRG